jgi:hypothetical protein
MISVVIALEMSFDDLIVGERCGKSKKKMNASKETIETPVPIRAAIVMVDVVAVPTCTLIKHSFNWLDATTIHR